MTVTQLVLAGVCWSKSSIKIILVYIVSGLNLLKTRPWLNQEGKVNVITARSFRLVIEILKSCDQF